MRAAVLQLAFDGLGAERAISGAFRDNASSISVSRALGYEENGVAWQAPRGEPRELVNFLLPRAVWERRRDAFPRAVVTGLDACRDWFGIAA
jgi:RimJ/RimL family protein N-acetyltransferase